MEIIQECAKAFKNMVDTTSYVYHVSLNKRIKTFEIDFKTIDFHHAIGLQYLEDISIPKNKKKTIDWILNPLNNVTDEYLAKDSEYKGKPNQERDVELRISEFRFLEEYLDEENTVYIYSPKDAPYKGSIIPCDYIIESYLKSRNHTVFIFIKHRSGADSPCKIVSFGVKKNVEYGGMLSYVMLKDKLKDNNRTNIFKHPRYTLEQIQSNEPTVDLNYIKKPIKKTFNKALSGTIT